MKKFIVLSVIFSMILVLPAMALTKKATLINAVGKKVVVAVGSPAAQQYFNLGYWLMGSQNLGKASFEFIKYAADVIGSKTGTSTSPTAFYDGLGTASSSKVLRLGGQKSQAIFNFQATEASSTPSGRLVVSFWGSNDSFCDTATSSTYYSDIEVKEDVTWFDIGDHYTDKTNVAALANTASTTFDWFPTGRKEKIMSLENLNYECVRLDYAASSTKLFAQMRSK